MITVLANTVVVPILIHVMGESEIIKLQYLFSFILWKSCKI